MPDVQRPKFSSEFRKRINRNLCEMVSAAVASMKARDDDLIEYRDRIESSQVPPGVSGGAGQKAGWSCNLNHPLIQDLFITLVAQLYQVHKRPQQVQVEAVDPDDEDIARQVEEWLVTKYHQLDLAKTFGDIDKKACAEHTQFTYMGWQTTMRNYRSKKWFPADADPGEGNGFPSKPDDGKDYEQRWTLDKVETKEGADIRVTNLHDIYWSPPMAKSVDEAFLFCERMTLTAAELYAGIDDFGWDEDDVMELLGKGPGPLSTSDDYYTERQLQREGFEWDDYRARGSYEFFCVYTRLPVDYDSLDEEALDALDLYGKDEFMAMVCPGADTVLSLELSRYHNQRPYVPFNMMAVPDSLLGWCLPKLLAAIQAELNCTIQAAIDRLNYEMMPCFRGPKNNEDFKAGQNKFVPGGYLGEDVKDSVQPIVMPERSGLGIEWIHELRDEAQAMIASQGFGTMQPKQRKNAEIENTVNAAASKFDLYLSNMAVGVVMFFKRLRALYAENMPSEGEDYLYEGEKKHITAQALSEDFDFVPVGSSQTATMEARLQLAQQKTVVIQQFLDASTKYPNNKVQLWHGFRAVLFDMGENRPDKFIGEEPPPQPTQSGPGQQPAFNPIISGAQGAPNGGPGNNGNGGRHQPVAIPAGN